MSLDSINNYTLKMLKHDLSRSYKLGGGGGWDPIKLFSSPSTQSKVKVIWKPLRLREHCYLFKARIPEAEKQPLLGNGPYTRSRGTRHVRCDVRQK
jgi:hypothetical protein